MIIILFIMISLLFNNDNNTLKHALDCDGIRTSIATKFRNDVHELPWTSMMLKCNASLEGLYNVIIR